MKALVIKPEIYSFDTFEDFQEEFGIQQGDLIITNKFVLGGYSGIHELKADIIYQEEYGDGEASDEMIEAISSEIAKMGEHKRIIGIGGGTIIDISKLFALKNYSPIANLYEGKIKIEKNKELILIPTTCGTGSEVTNISILSFLKKHTKLGLADDRLYADQAVLIPEFLKNLPFETFVTSSIDAFIHAVESGLSPKSTVYTELFGYKAIEIILSGYIDIAVNGRDRRFQRLKEFLQASNFAGLAFATAGCGPVHALSYPYGGTLHVPHGEANYVVFMSVINRYQSMQKNEKLEKLKRHMASVMGCEEERVFLELEKLLEKLITKKTLREYGATREMIVQWTQNVMDSQQRLLENSPVKLGYQDVLEIYKTIYE